jgi:hypothetical protein
LDRTERAEESIYAGHHLDLRPRRRANCEVIALQNMPAGDIKVEWLAGCIAGTIEGQIAAIQSNGG